ncbi:MAG: discoidin domain-containing protein, partial [Rhodanobacteraceae bacterium]
ATSLYARYTLTNNAPSPSSITLALAARPFQVNPSVQFLNTPGGISPIRDLAWRREASEMHDAVFVDAKARVFPLDPANSFFASAFDSGMAVDRLANGAIPRDESIHDDTGFASGALIYRFDLPAHSSRSVVLQIPLDADACRDTFDVSPDAWYSQLRDRTAATWRGKLDDVRIRVPASAQALADTLRTALAHILISRDGAAIRPGTRSYARSWIRDGAMTSEALLRLGHADAARAYLEWYAPYQFKNGKVPCCVDARGSDPVPENDSHGELIHLASEVYRYTGDRALLETMWPHVDGAARYMDELRASERTPANRTAERIAFYGLMPASISHEGYSAKPMHSYWDDFWALTGYKNAVGLADALEKRDDAARIKKSRDEFHDDLYASIRSTVATHAIDYLPGCAELGDFDATSTTIALSPAGEQANLPQDLLLATFERYWKQLVERRDGLVPWKDYTPYEWRTVGTFVRLGWRERAGEAIKFFMHDRRPAAWNQWAEVVGRDARESRFVGDMPHGWVASDFIRSALDLFAYERESDQSIVIAAGIQPEWIEGDGVSIENLRTPFGKLGYSIERVGERVRLVIGASDLRLPPGGIVFAWPRADASAEVRVNGRRAAWEHDGVRVHSLPATVEITGSTRQQ